jgi:hypothetical protein
MSFSPISKKNRKRLIKHSILNPEESKHDTTYFGQKSNVVDILGKLQVFIYKLIR